MREQQTVELSVKNDTLSLIIDTPTSRQENKGIVVFVHGLGGNPNQHIFFNATEYLIEEGYDTCRFSLYTKKYPLSKLSLSDQTERLQDVIDYIDSNYENYYLVGHSLAGPMLMQSDHNGAKALVLWDSVLKPSHRLKRDFSQVTKQYWKTNRSVDFLVSKELYHEMSNLSIDLLKKVYIPTKVICAERPTLKDERQEHIDLIEPDHTLHIVTGANHWFDTLGSEQELFAETIDWIRKY